MNARPRLASAAARRSFGSVASTCTLTARSPSSARLGDGITAWAPVHPTCPARVLAAPRRPVAPPLAVRQHGVGVGLLLEHEPAIPPALGAPADPVQDPEFAQPGQRRGDSADADAGLVRDRLIGRVQPAGAMVQEIEDQRVQHGERGGPTAPPCRPGWCVPRSKCGRGARGARRPSWPWRRSGRSASCCPTTPARRGSDVSTCGSKNNVS